MKNLLAKFYLRFVIFYFFLVAISFQVSAQAFQRAFGTSLDNSFSKVIKDGNFYYVLGQDESIDGSPMNATVTRLDAFGQHLWTLTLSTPSIWNDGVRTPTGDLLVVGSTLPFDPNSKSLMGLVTPAAGGNFSWVRSYDVPGRETFTRIVKNSVPQDTAYSYYVLGSQNQPGASSTTDDVVVLNLNASGVINWKKIFDSNADDKFSYELEALQNGDLFIGGNDAYGEIFQTDNAINQISGVQISGISFTDISAESSGGFYVSANNLISGNIPHLLKFDQDLIVIWDVGISALTSINQVWEGQPGELYATGRGIFGGISRGVIVKLTDNTFPSVSWVKYLNTGTSFKGGSSWLMPNSDIAFTDSRIIPAGFGQNCAFISISDLNITTCAVSENNVDLVFFDPVPNGPVAPPVIFQEIPIGIDLPSQALNWQQSEVCSNDTCTADFTFQIDCGMVTFTDQSNVPNTPSWQWTFQGGSPSSSTTQNPVVSFTGCDTYTVCLTATGTGPFSSCSETTCHNVTILDNTPPVALCLGVGVSLNADCQAIITPSLIDGGSFDNCLIQSMSVSPSTVTGCGLFPVTLTVTDWCGNTSTCSTMVQTIENIPPVITCPPNITVNASGPSPCSKAVNGIQPINVSDNCSTPTVSFMITGATSGFGQNNASGSTFNQGVSTVTYTATDDCGNTATCSFTVTVICGQADGNNCGWTVGTYYSPTPTGQVGVIYDTRFNSAAILGADWGVATIPVPKIEPQDWKRNIIGNVFGIALDNNGKIFLAASDVYRFDGGLASAVGNGGSAGIYKTDLNSPGYPTSNIVGTLPVTTLAIIGGTSLPNTGGIGNGIGNIAYDHLNNQLFLTNLEDGRIYRIDPNGNLKSAYDPFNLTNGIAGIEPPAERIWGIGILNNRVYFAREESSTNPKQIWSIPLDPTTGEFMATETSPGSHLYTDPARLEINNGPGLQKKYTDIAFSQNGQRMLIAERGYPHDAAVFEFQNPAAWVPGNNFAVGDHTSGKNSAGGVDYGYREINGNPKAFCDGLIWATANCMDPNGIPGNWCQVYGMEGISANGNSYPANSGSDIYIDFDGVYNTNPKYQIGDVEVFKCGCDQLAVCDSISVTSMPSNGSQDTCCFKLTINNIKPNFFTGIQLCSSNGVSISNISVLNGWCLQSYSATQVTLLPPGCVPNEITTGTQDFFNLCLSNYQIVPSQQIIVKYLGPNYEEVCRDTLIFNCTQKPKCLKITDTVECGQNGTYEMNFCIMSNAFINFNVGSFVLNPPANVTFTPNVFTPNPSPLFPGQMQCNFHTTISGAVDGQTICYSVTGHKGNILSIPPPSDPTPCCTDTVMLACVTMPDCVCNKLSAETMAVNLPGDTCCWKVTLTNNYSNTYFTGVELEIKTGGVIFGAITNGLPVWSLASGPKIATFTKLPFGTYIGSSATLPTFCLSGISNSNQVPQIVLLKWLDTSKKVVCVDTLKFYCPPPVESDCAVLVSPRIECDSSSPYVYNLFFQVHNNTGFTINQVVLNNPPGVVPNQFNLTPVLPNNQTSVQVFSSQILGYLPGQQVCFYLKVNDIGPNGNELNCCTHSQQYCFTLPNCPCDSVFSSRGLTGDFPFLTNAQDLSPTGISGFVNGPSSVTGHDNVSNSAYHFNGISDGIDVTTDNRNITNEVTIVAWVKTSELLFGQWVAGKYAFSEDKGYGLSIGTNANTNIGYVAFGGRDGTSTYYSSGFSTTKVNDGNWHCVVGTAGNNQWKVYVDGVIENNAVGSTNNLATSLNERFTIGYHTDPNNPLWMDGDIDNVLIYNRVLTDDEIECLCSGTLPDIEYCDCGTANNPIPNQIANGSFESGYSGFSTSLTPNNPCVWSSYVVANNANIKCGSWPSLHDHTTGTGNFMVIDGNPAYASNIWSEPVNVTPRATYCFSFWTASIYSKSQQDFDLNMVINGMIGTIPTSKPMGTINIAEVFLPSQTIPKWINHSLTWTCPIGFVGPYTIDINQVAGAHGDDYTDFGIDDICFAKTDISDTCFCANPAFTDLFLRGPGGPSIPINCETSYDNIICPIPGYSFSLSGLFQCAGDSCVDSSYVYWHLDGPSGMNSGVTTGSYFTIHLLPAYFTQSGIYTMLLQGFCGMDTCKCEFQMAIECPNSCPCDQPAIFALQAAVNQGFSQVLYPVACQGCFTPIALSDCETVNWYLTSTSGTFLGSSIGNNTFCYPFSVSGTYTVIMEVTRLKPDGTICEKFTKADTVRINCQHIPGCDNSAMTNPSFSDGSPNAGGLYSGGVSFGWKGISGEPEVIEGQPGSLDGWTMQLWGNLDTASILSQTEAMCLKKDTGTIRLRIEYILQSSGQQSSMIIALYTGDSFSTSGCNEIDCYKLGTIDLSNLTPGEWYDVEIPYDIRNWMATDSCADGQGVFVRPAIYVTNALGSNQGGSATYTIVQVDNFCVDGTIVAVKDLTDLKSLHIYPNPTTGDLYVELPVPALTNMSLRVISLTGNILMNKKAIPGSEIQTLEASYLPEGMYFLQIVSEGRVLSVNKFVKQ